MSTDFPQSWLRVLLNDVGEIVTGKTPSTKNPDNFGGSIPFIKPADLDNGGYVTQTADTLTDAGAKLVPTIPPNSIPVTCIGNLGKVGITNQTSATNQQINTVVPSSQVDYRFFYYQLKTLKPWMQENASATTVTIINKGKFAKAPVTLPPLAEQKVIADKLDTLLAQVENTKARLERIPQILKRFRQSVLAAAVSWRLTEEWRGGCSCSPVDETRADIAFHRTQETKRKAKAPQAHLKQEEYPIPDLWKWVSLDSLAKKIVDGTHHTPAYTDKGVPFISVKDIRGGKVSFENTKFISEEEHSELSKRCLVEEGDLLITKSGTIGRTAIVRTGPPFSIFVSVALIKPASRKVNVRYIDLALQKWINEIDVSSRIVGSAIKNLHLR